MGASNNYEQPSKDTFSEKVVNELYGTVADKKITFLVGHSKDTNDTRESAAIYIADRLIEERAKIEVYDPKVNRNQMLSDLNYLGSRKSLKILLVFRKIMTHIKQLAVHTH